MAEFILPLASPAAHDADRVGPKAANLARLAQAGLPTPGGLCITALAYRRQLQHLGLVAMARDYAEAHAQGDDAAQRRLSVEIRLALYQSELAPDLLGAILTAWRDMAKPAAVRSSALIEDRADSSFAGQFESFLGLREDGEFFTALRACWAALWTGNARTAMARHDLVPSGTAMAVLVQPLVAAHASGGGLSKTADGQMTLSATWGLGSTLAQGELVPDRIVLSRAGFVRKNEPGRKHHSEACAHRAGTMTQSVPDEMARAPCLQAGQATALGRLMRRAEAVLGQPVEIEWALDDEGFKVLQARPLRVAQPCVVDEIWLKHPGLNGHPAGIGWGAGRAVVVQCECELGRIAPGDVLVTRVAGPALAHILPRVAGVVAELGGSTSHLASLARERGIPMVLGVNEATQRIPDGAQVAVDGVAGIVRWLA